MESSADEGTADGAEAGSPELVRAEEPAASGADAGAGAGAGVAPDDGRSAAAEEAAAKRVAAFADAHARIRGVRRARRRQRVAQQRMAEALAASGGGSAAGAGGAGDDSAAAAPGHPSRLPGSPVADAGTGGSPRDILSERGNQPQKRRAPFAADSPSRSLPAAAEIAGPAADGGATRSDVAARSDDSFLSIDDEESEESDAVTGSDGGDDPSDDSGGLDSGGSDSDADSDSDAAPTASLSGAPAETAEERARSLAVWKEWGNTKFKNRDYDGAMEDYEKGILYAKEEDAEALAVLMSNRAACLIELKRWEEAVQDCSAAVDLNPAFPRSYLRRARCYEQLAKWNDAAGDLKKACELDSSLIPAHAKRLRVAEQKAAEEFEKQKEELMGKLKDFGNWALGKFGLSLDNFKMEQNESGSYNIQYVQSGSQGRAPP